MIRYLPHDAVSDGEVYEVPIRLSREQILALSNRDGGTTILEAVLILDENRDPAYLTTAPEVLAALRKAPA